MTNDQLLLAEVREMRKLLELIAEPAIAQRDAKFRDELRKIVGNSAKKQKSVFLMDGSRTQSQIVSETSVDHGDLSKMVNKFETSGLLVNGRKQPKLVINVPANFFDGDSEPKRR